MWPPASGAGGGYLRCPPPACNGSDYRLLFPEQTQESIQRFEQQAGLREAGYTPHKGLTTEETKYLRVAEALHKLTLQSGERTRDEKQPASAQSSPGGTPHSSPKQKSR